MHSLSSILIPIALLVEAGSAAYDLNNNYTPANFFSAFTFFTVQYHLVTIHCFTTSDL